MVKITQELPNFNPENFAAQQQTYNRDIASKGNSTIGTALSGAGSVIAAAAKATDFVYKQKTENFLKEGVDKINDQHGVAEAADIVSKGGIPYPGVKGDSSSIGNAVSPTGLVSDGGTTVDPQSGMEAYGQADGADIFSGGGKGSAKGAPPGVAKIGNQVTGIQAAYDAGKMSNSYYDAQLVALVKQAKAQYPGYKDVIDQQVSSIVGYNPANQLRKTMLNDLDMAERAKNSEGNKWDAFVKAKLPQIQTMFPNQDVSTILRNNSHTDIMNGVAKLDAQKYQNDAAKLQIEVDEQNAKDPVTAVKTQKQFTEEANQIVSNGIAGQVNLVSGGKTINLSKMLSDAQDKVSRGETIGPQEKAQLLSYASQFKQQLSDKIDAAANEPLAQGSTRTMMSVGFSGNAASQYAEMKKNAMTRADGFFDAISSQQYGVVGATARWNTASQEAAVQNVAKAWPQGDVIKAITDKIGPNGLQIVMMDTKTGPIVMNNILTGLQTTGLANIVNPAPGSTPSIISNATAAKDANHGVTPPPAFNRETVRQGMAVLTDEKNFSVEARQNAAHFFFSNDPGKTGFISSLPADQRSAWYGRLASTDVADKMKRLGGQENQDYVAWVKNNFVGINKQLATTLQAARPGGYETHGDVTLSPVDNQFVYTPKAGYLDDPRVQGSVRKSREGIIAGEGKMVNDFNANVKTLEYTLKINGEKNIPAVLHHMFTNELGIDLSAKQGGMLTAIGAKISEYADTHSIAPDSETSISGKPMKKETE